MTDFAVCPGSKPGRHRWRWNDLSFSLPTGAGDVQECALCGVVRLLDETGGEAAPRQADMAAGLEAWKDRGADADA